jgi:hypothetical protein
MSLVHRTGSWVGEQVTQEVTELVITPLSTHGPRVAEALGMPVTWPSGPPPAPPEPIEKDRLDEARRRPEEIDRQRLARLRTVEHDPNLLEALAEG